MKHTHPLTNINFRESPLLRLVGDMGNVYIRAHNPALLVIARPHLGVPPSDEAAWIEMG